MTRRSARELIMQMLFEWTFHQEEDVDRIIGERLKEINEKEEGTNKAVIKFIEDLFYGTVEQVEVIDGLITQIATNWSITRLSKVDLSILRLAIYEIKYTDVPQKVAVNEALEIAKAYSTDKSPHFINGVLGSVIKLIEA